MNVDIPHLHPYGNELRKIGTDNRTADIEMMNDEELKKEFENGKPLCELMGKRNLLIVRNTINVFLYLKLL